MCLCMCEKHFFAFHSKKLAKIFITDRIFQNQHSLINVYDNRSILTSAQQPFAQLCNTSAISLHTYNHMYLYKLRASARNCTLHYSKINITLCLRASSPLPYLFFIVEHTLIHIHPQTHTYTHSWKMRCEIL